MSLGTKNREQQLQEFKSKREFVGKYELVGGRMKERVVLRLL